MTPQDDHTTIRAVLEQRLLVLGGEIEAARLRGASQLESGAEVEDRKDQAAREERQEVGDAEFERDLQEFRAVRAALERLASGRYGVCIDCGEPIPRARLQVQPAAERCAACQAVAERRPASS